MCKVFTRHKIQKVQKGMKSLLQSLLQPPLHFLPYPRFQHYQFPVYSSRAILGTYKQICMHVISPFLCRNVSRLQYFAPCFLYLIRFLGDISTSVSRASLSLMQNKMVISRILSEIQTTATLGNHFSFDWQNIMTFDVVKGISK